MPGSSQVKGLMGLKPWVPLLSFRVTEIRGPQPEPYCWGRTLAVACFVVIVAFVVRMLA